MQVQIVLPLLSSPRGHLVDPHSRSPSLSVSQAIQKRDALLRQSEADLLQVREKIRGRAADAEREVVSARGLEADLQRAKKEKKLREKECASLKTQLLKLTEELKDAQTNCRDAGNNTEYHIFPIAQ